jgi:hypothetical protein
VIALMGFYSFFTELLSSKVLAETPCISTILSSSGSQIKIGHELNPNRKAAKIKTKQKLQRFIYLFSELISIESQPKHYESDPFWGRRPVYAFKERKHNSCGPL